MSGFTHLPAIFEPSLILTHGNGDYVFDKKGRKYIDFTGGIAVHSFGHRSDIIGPAIQRQLQKISHCSGYFTTPSQLKLSETLVNFANKACDTNHFSASYISNSGTEANEAALKFARITARRLTSKNKKTQFIAFSNSFHGRTMGALSVTGNEAYKESSQPLIPNCTILPFNNSIALAKAVSIDTAAIIVEPIQGEGGLHRMTQGFANTISKAAEKFDIFIICDEVQSGLYRSGSALACADYNLKPDIITLAKSLGGGFPIGATIISNKINSALAVGDHGTTMGGNPLACEAALAVLKKLRSPLLHIERNYSAHYLYKKTKNLVLYIERKFPTADPVLLGRGHLMGIKLSSSCNTQKILDEARKSGLLLLRTGKNSLRFAPSFICNHYVIKCAFKILKKSIVKTLKSDYDQYKEV